MESCRTGRTREQAMAVASAGNTNNAILQKIMNFYGVLTVICQIIGKKCATTFLKQCRDNDKAIATRKASQQCIEYFAARLPEMLGGSADLTGSITLTGQAARPLPLKIFLGITFIMVCANLPWPQL